MHIFFGDQLFYSHISKIKTKNILFIESLDLVKRRRYHKYKLTYLFTTMREFASYLTNEGFTVTYYTLEDAKPFFETIIEEAKKHTEIQFFEPADYSFRTYLYSELEKHTIKHTVLPNPAFLYTPQEFTQYYTPLKEKKKRILMHDFYLQGRRKWNILLQEGKPVGGKWSFDDENRKKLPKTAEIPQKRNTYSSQIYQEVSQYISQELPDYPGEIPSESYFALNREQALESLHIFISSYFENFGVYEDALTTRDDFVFHSALSPMLNNGLLTPYDILTALDDGFGIYGNTFKENTPLNSLEGYIRQIIGWREWIKGLSECEYKHTAVKQFNFFEAKNTLPKYFWTLKDEDLVEIQENIPLVTTLQKVRKTGYNHHIERLMILANYMTLQEYDPVECYEWFMCMYLDAFEWVMKGNVLGMGIFADGGIFATKPYVAGGNYIKKMGDYPNSKEWEEIWTDLFWKFLCKHEEFFEKNPRMNMLIQARKKKLSQD